MFSLPVTLNCPSVRLRDATRSSAIAETARVVLHKPFIAKN